MTSYPDRAAGRGTAAKNFNFWRRSGDEARGVTIHAWFATRMSRTRLRRSGKLVPAFTLETTKQN